MPLHLLLGLRTSLTPSAALQRRRTSLGISLKYRHWSFGLHRGPSVNRKPVQTFSTTAFLSTSCSNSGVFTSTDVSELSIRFVLLDFWAIELVIQTDAVQSYSRLGRTIGETPTSLTRSGCPSPQLNRFLFRGNTNSEALHRVS